MTTLPQPTSYAKRTVAGGGTTYVIVADAGGGALGHPRLSMACELLGHMTDLYTKDGRPLRQRGDDLFSRSGEQVGRIRGNKVYGPDGRYAGTIDGDRVVYRSTDSATTSSPFAPSRSAASGAANSARSGLWGDEPAFPD
jgi:hypothetical protein